MEPQMQKAQISQVQAEQVFNIALGERRKVNIEKMQQFYTKRNENYIIRLRILNLLNVNFNEKIKYTLGFMKGIINYFEGYINLYSDYFKGMSKLGLQKKGKDTFIYEAVLTAVLQLAQFNNTQVEKAKKFITWIQKMLVPGLKMAQGVFIQSFNEMKKQLRGHAKMHEQSHQKQVKMYEKLQSGNDLLQKQILWIDRLKKSDQTIKDWGNSLYKNWKLLLEKQQELKKIFQQNILDFSDKFLEVYYKPDMIKGLVTFWRNMPHSPTIIEIFNAILGQPQVQFIKFGCKQKKFLTNFQSFLNIDHQLKRSGNPVPICKILESKLFKGKVPKEKSQRQWLDISIIFTVDKNVLFYYQMESKVILKLKQKGLSTIRTSQNILQVTGIEEGFLIDSTKKQPIHFDTFDLLQQFECYVKLLSAPV